MALSHRTFLASLLASLFALPAALKAFASKPAAPEPLNLDEICEQLYRIKANRVATDDIRWFQSTRVVCCMSIEYEDAVDRVFLIHDEPERVARFIARRIERSRKNLAAAKLQRPLPLP